MKPPYALPDTPTIINFSGGRSSGYMLRKILDHYDDHLPEHVRVAFTNTGKEREETLEFVRECGARWSVPITWLEYRHHPAAAGGKRDPRHRHAIVNFDTASRNGEPFRALCLAKSMIPNVTMRFCTSELKVSPVRWWTHRDLGWPYKFHSVLGMRYDEPKRWAKAMMEECRSVYPMALDGTIKADVERFWEASPFDLGIHSDEGNCDLCFLKGKGKLIRLIRSDPSRVAWWSDLEDESENFDKRRKTPLRNKSQAHFSRRHTFAELLAEAQSRTLLDALEEDDSISCFCGD